jgi:polyphosphate kinase
MFIFENAGDPIMYMGSADLMPRNLIRRVELIFPVEEAALKQRALEVFEVLWADNVNAREQDAEGNYEDVPQKGRIINAQRELARAAREELRAAQRETDA